MKFRIVQLIHNVAELSQENRGRASIEYVIQKKNFWGKWKEVFATEIESSRISHKTYEDAEAYMLHHYMGHGMCEKIGVEYEYTPYSYYCG
jgi:hypothetical protein